MPVMIALLRGVNIGGHCLVKMDALRGLCESMGLGDVRTYVQSGNVVFSTRGTKGLAARLEAAIEGLAGFRPTVVLRTAEEMRAVVEANPFSDVPGNKLAVLFFTSEPPPPAWKALLKPGMEAAHLSGREAYIHYVNGFGKAKLTTAAIERTLKMKCTARNWNTVLKLVEMAG
jgi:uncharacterized protein (DUF1697 family)